MKDSIKESFEKIPDFNPGIPGYGQMGSFGKQGPFGSNVYYTSFNLSDRTTYIPSDKTEMASKYKRYSVGSQFRACERLINMNMELSNNFEKKSGLEYKVNDVVIDSTGTFYRIRKVNPERGNEGEYIPSPVYGDSYETPVDITLTLEPLMKKGASLRSQSAPAFEKLNASCVTSTLKSSKYKNIQANPLCVNGKDAVGTQDLINRSPKIYHKDYYQKNKNGNFVKFNLIYNSTVDISNYTIRYVLCMPNGQTFDTYTDGQPNATIFIDNAYFYGCYDEKWNCQMADVHETQDDVDQRKNNDHISASPISETLYQLFTKNRADLDTNPVFFRHLLDDTLTLNTETSPEDINANANSAAKISTICSCFIKNNCTAYAEITSNTTGKMYRVDVNEIHLDQNDDIIQSNEKPYIDSSSPMLVWNLHTYPENLWLSRYKDDSITITPPVNEEENEDDEETEENSEDNDEQVYYGITTNRENAYRAMDQYVSFPEQEVGLDAPVDSEDGKAIHTFFVSENGMQDYINNGSVGGLYIKEYYANNMSEDIYNPLYDLNNPEIHLNHNTAIRMWCKNARTLSLYINFNKNNEDFTTSMIYVGMPDCNLIQYGSKKLSDDMPGAFDVDVPGIYYMYKILPPNIYETGSTEVTKVANAGIVSINIDLGVFGISPTEYHFIEIAIIDFGTVHNANNSLNTDKKNHRSTEQVFASIQTEEGYAKYLNAISFCGNHDTILCVDGVTESPDSITNTLNPMEYNPLTSSYLKIDRGTETLNENVEDE